MYDSPNVRNNNKTMFCDCGQPEEVLVKVNQLYKHITQMQMESVRSGANICITK